MKSQDCRRFFHVGSYLKRDSIEFTYDREKKKRREQKMLQLMHLVILMVDEFWLLLFVFASKKLFTFVGLY